MSDQPAARRPWPADSLWRKVRGGLRRLKRYGQKLLSASARARVASVTAWHRRRPPPIVDNILVWCQQTAKLPAEILLSPTPVVRQPPHTLEPEVHERYLQRLSYTTPSVYLTCIPQARLTGATGWLVLPTGQFALEMTFGQPSHFRADPGYMGPRPAKKRPMRGDYYSLTIVWCRTSSYYHWVHDSLLRLYGVAERLPPGVRFIVPSNLRPYQRDSLRALNIAEDQLALYGEDEEWVIERLHFSPPITRTGHDLPAADRWLNQRMRAAFGVGQPRARRRIFVSRRGGRGRSIVNETEVEDLLRPRGFETFRLEDLTFGQQVALFAEAEIVVGSHGAGLTNILFANEGLHVVEIFEPRYVNTCFWTMSEALKYQYSYLMGQTEPLAGYDANIVVPIDKLRTTLVQHGYY